MFLPFPFTIWLSLIFTDFPVSVLSLLQASVTVFLRDQFSLGGIQLWRAVVQGQLWGADRKQKNPVPGWSLVPVSWWLWTGFSWARNLKKSGSLNCTHRLACTRGTLALFRHYLGMDTCVRESAPGTDRNPEGSCPRSFLGSGVLRVLSRYLWAVVVVLPVPTGLSALLWS